MKVRYAENGNITWKYDVNNGQEGYYCYVGNSPYAVSGIGTSANCSVNNFNYDNNGNMISGRDRTIVYSHFDKATLITSNNSVTSFAYGTNHSRYKRSTTEQVNGKTVTTTTYYLGNIEVISKSNTNVVTTRRNLPGAVEVRRNNNTKAEISYLLKDHLGSIDTITDAKGFIKQKLYFDPWGKKHIIDSANVIDNLNSFTTLSLTALLDVTTRGYTGHESVDHADIIHMNGRIYDPTLGRFLQADPHIQAPKNSQNYNRYSYVLNNPMSYTDPSGYFFKKLFKGIKKYWRQIASIGMMFIPGMQAFAMANWYQAAAVGFLSGGIATGSLRGALVGAFSGAALQSIGSSATWGKAGSAENIIANAAVGGVAADLNGGKFGHGFFAAGFTASFKPQINKIGDGAASYTNARVAAAAIVGGTASVISGGKFANGAVTGAFIQMFNAETALKRRPKFYTKDERLTDKVAALNKASLDGKYQTIGGNFEQDIEIAFSLDVDMVDDVTGQKGYMQVTDGVPNRILVGTTALNDSSIGEFSLGVGHELVHIRDQGVSRAQTEYNAHGWAASNIDSFNITDSIRETQLQVWNMQMQSFWRGLK